MFIDIQLKNNYTHFMFGQGVNFEKDIKENSHRHITFQQKYILQPCNCNLTTKNQAFIHIKDKMAT